MIESAPLVLGTGQDELTVAVGVVASLAASAVVLGMIAFALLPSLSERWAERFGVSALGEDAPDPADVVPGYMDPVTIGADGGVEETPDADLVTDEIAASADDGQPVASSPVDADSSA